MKTLGGQEGERSGTERSVRVTRCPQGVRGTRTFLLKATLETPYGCPRLQTGEAGARRPGPRAAAPGEQGPEGRFRAGSVEGAGPPEPPPPGRQLTVRAVLSQQAPGVGHRRAVRGRGGRSQWLPPPVTGGLRKVTWPQPTEL